MAYFGGVQTGRPWPKFDIRPIAAMLVGLSLATLIFLTLGSKLFAPTVVEKPVQPVVVPPQVNPPMMKKAAVVIPKQTIWPGQRLSVSMFKMEQRSIEGIESKVYFDTREIEGAFANSIIVENAPVLRDHINSSLSINPLTARIPAGHRAVTIRVDAESAVEGWVRPGVRVDVVWSSRHLGKLIVSTIIENALVLSAARSTQRMNPEAKAAPPQGIPGMITLLLPIRDAQKLHLAKKSSGTLSLSLRGDADTAERGSDTMSVESLLRREDVNGLLAVQGKVKFAGKDYVLRGGKLVQAYQDAEEGKTQANAGQKIIQ